MGVGLGNVRHLGVAGHPALHRVHPEPVRDQRGPLSGRDAATELFKEATFETARLHHDPGRMG